MRYVSRNKYGDIIGEYILQEDGYYRFSPNHEYGPDFNEDQLLFIILQLRKLNGVWDVFFKTDPCFPDNGEFP